MMSKIEDLIKSGFMTGENIKTDSRLVKGGDIFVALKGTEHDGHDYARQALEKGASFVLCEKDPSGLEDEYLGKVLVVQGMREELGRIAHSLFGRPSESLSVHGVTGTNGKTSTVFLIDTILNNAGISSGFISTVFIKTAGDVFRRSTMTTPDALTLNRLLSEIVADRKKAAAVEISSHALVQGRVRGIGLDSAVFTNITPEHLDYHKDMDTYFRDKTKIFRNLKPGGMAVINADDPMVGSIRTGMDPARLVTFGIDCPADVSAGDIRFYATGTEFDLYAVGLGKTRLKTALIGKHNVYNVLAAVSALLNSGLDLGIIKEGLEKAVPVPGRLDVVSSNTPFRVFVDYAHTPDALENILKCLRPLAEGRIICVFGCGGDRDRSKRPVMGDIAVRLSDHAVLTSDNPRTEDPFAILGEIEKGMRAKNNYSIIEDRRNAIKEALKMADKGDIVVIAGKGHEDHQIIGRTRTHFDDKETAGEILKELGC